jgi:hypothetical protein
MIDETVAATANKLLDSVSALAVLRHPETFAMTQEEVRDEAALVNGERLFSTTKLSRFENDPERTPTPPGLEKTAIARLYYTSSRIGVACQELELSLRVADFEKKPLEHLIRAAEEFLRDARKWIVNLYQNKAVDAATLAEWNLDCASLDSLAQQMRLYRARFADNAQKARLYTESLKFGRDVRKRLHDAISSCPNAEAADVILAGRSLLNAFFATFMLDVLDGRQNNASAFARFRAQCCESSDAPDRFQGGDLDERSTHCALSRRTGRLGEPHRQAARRQQCPHRATQSQHDRDCREAGGSGEETRQKRTDACSRLAPEVAYR